MSWKILGKKDGSPEVGKIYEVAHNRKGNFVGEVLEINGEFAKIKVLEGKVGRLSRETRLVDTEIVSVRDSLSYLVPVEESEQT